DDGDLSVKSHLASSVARIAWACAAQAEDTACVASRRVPSRRVERLELRVERGSSFNSQSSTLNSELVCFGLVCSPGARRGTLPDVARSGGCDVSQIVAVPTMVLVRGARRWPRRSTTGGAGAAVTTDWGG